MDTYKRRGNKWTVNELISLQREYELLELTIKEIAIKHQRSVEAILFRLESEGFIDKWSTSRGFDDYFYNNKYVEDESEEEDDEESDDEESEEDDEESDDEESDEEDDVDKLVERVWNLETNIKEIGSIVKQIFNNMITNSSKSTSLKMSK